MNLRGKCILVTGADGFIGSHLTEHLAREGARVRALAYYNSFNDWGWLEDIVCRDQVEVVTGDIRDPHVCLHLCRGVDIVYHLAALIAIPYSYQSPDSYVDTNVKGTLNICQAALKQGVARMIHMSTSEVYGTAQYVPIDENHPLRPQSPYAATKAAADALALSFHFSFGLPVVIARPFNTYGPRQSARAVIPTIITQMLAGTAEVKLGNPVATRDFTYVSDTCAALALLGQMECGLGEVFNIGSNKEIAIKDLFELIRQAARSEAALSSVADRFRQGKSEVERLRCANGKLHSATGFSPSIRLREGIARTIAWFHEPAHRRRYKEGIYNV